MLGGGQSFSYALSDGSTLSFTLKGTTDTASGLAATAVPVSVSATIGNGAYLNIPNKPALMTPDLLATVTLTLSNITVTPSPGVASASRYQIVIADAEATQLREALSYTTNGGNWSALDQVTISPSASYPTLVNIGAVATIAGAPNALGSTLLGTTNPTTVSVRLVSSGISRQAVIIGIRLASVSTGVNLTGGRANPADQITSTITNTASGAPLTTVTTSGAGVGLTQSGGVSIGPGVESTVSASMAAGSVSRLGGYALSLTCSNANASSNTTLPVKVVTSSFALGPIAFGDVISCAFTAVPRAPTVAVQLATIGGTGGPYDIAQTGLTISPPAITTINAGVAAPSSPTPITTAILGSNITLTAPASLTLVSASCADTNSAVNGNAGNLGTLSGNTLAIPATSLSGGAALLCSFSAKFAVAPIIRRGAASGTVYDAITGSPVANPKVRLCRSDDTAIADVDLVDGVSFAQVSGHPECRERVFAGATGTYSIVFNRLGDYTLAFRGAGSNYPPTNAASGTSLAIPGQTATLTPTADNAACGTGTATICAVQPQSGAPSALSDTTATRYFTLFSIVVGGLDVINNNLPVDPIAPPQVSISKTADKDTAELGDIVKYSIDLTASGGGVLRAVQVEDQLPRGFRYIANTTSLVHNGGAATLTSDVVLGITSSDPLLIFRIGALASGDTLRVSYRVRIGVGAERGDGINRAHARFGAQLSAEARAKVKVGSGAFWNQACIVGTVFRDDNGNGLKDAGESGIGDVRLYLEDGTWFRTDDAGKYSYCGLEPITHVIAVDKSTLPPGSVLLKTSNRNALDPGSLFLDVKFGELMRADFAVRAPAHPGMTQ